MIRFLLILTMLLITAASSLAQSYAELASSALAHGNTKEALEFIHKDIDLKTQFYTADSVEVAIARGSLGDALRRAGRYDEAVTELTKAQKRVIQEVLRPGHRPSPEDNAIAALTRSLVMVYDAMGKGKEAVASVREAIDILEHLAVKDSPWLADLFLSLGESYIIDGKMKPAATAIENGTAMLEKIMANRPDQLSGVYTHLQMVYYKGEHYKDAEAYARKALEMAAKPTIHNEKALANCENNLGSVLLKLHEADEARTLLESAMHRYVELDGADGEELMQPQLNLAQLCCQLKNPKEGVEHAQEALRICLLYHSESHPDSGKCYQDLGGILMEAGEYPAAVVALEKSVEIFEKTLGKSHASTRRSRASLSEAKVKARE